jgi:hypothetical protein
MQISDKLLYKNFVNALKLIEVKGQYLVFDFTVFKFNRRKGQN